MNFSTISLTLSSKFLFNGCNGGLGSSVGIPKSFIVALIVAGLTKRYAASITGLYVKKSSLHLTASSQLFQGFDINANSFGKTLPVTFAVPSHAIKGKIKPNFGQSQQSTFNLPADTSMPPINCVKLGDASLIATMLPMSKSFAMVAGSTFTTTLDGFL